MNKRVEDILSLKPTEKILSNTEYGFDITYARAADDSFQILYTQGLRNYQQQVNDDNASFEHIELYILLPSYWNLERDQYPVNWLERLAIVPQKNNTWFGVGDTIPAGNPPEELAENFSANHFMLRPPIQLKDQLSGELWDAEMNFQFLAVIPLYQDEINFKLRNSHSMLFKKMDSFGYTEQWDIYRPSSIKKFLSRLFGSFTN